MDLEINTALTRLGIETCARWVAETKVLELEAEKAQLVEYAQGLQERGEGLLQERDRYKEAMEEFHLAISAGTLTQEDLKEVTGSHIVEQGKSGMHAPPTTSVILGLHVTGLEEARALRTMIYDLRKGQAGGLRTVMQADPA